MGEKPKRQMMLKDLHPNAVLKTMVSGATTPITGYARFHAWHIIRCTIAHPKERTSQLMLCSQGQDTPYLDTAIETVYPDDEDGFDAAMSAMQRAIGLA
jgi:hypothetical protein